MCPNEFFRRDRGTELTEEGGHCERAGGGGVGGKYAPVMPDKNLNIFCLRIGWLNNAVFFFFDSRFAKKLVDLGSLKNPTEPASLSVVEGKIIGVSRHSGL
jgi:hypothetical protein